MSKCCLYTKLIETLKIQIRTLEQSLEGLGMPYLDSEAASEDAQRILGEIQKIGRLECDSKRTMEDIVAAENCTDEDGENENAGATVDPVEFYGQFEEVSVTEAKDATGKPLGIVWDIAGYTSQDGNTKQVVIVHAKSKVTIAQASTGEPLVTYDVLEPSELPDLRIDLKHVAVCNTKKLILLTQNDKSGIFSIPIPDAIPVEAKSVVLDIEMKLEVQGPGDSWFCGTSVDDRNKLIYVCDQQRSKVSSYSLENGALVNNFQAPMEFKPFKCALSPTRRSGSQILAITDYTNERVIILTIQSGRNWEFLPSSVSRGPNLGQVHRPGGLAYDITGNLLVTEGPNRRVQVNNLILLLPFPFSLFHVAFSS